MANKLEIENEFTAWVNADPARKAKYGNALNLIKKGYEDMADYSVAMAYLQEALGGPELHMFAFRTSNLLEKLSKKDTLSDDKKEKIREAS